MMANNDTLKIAGEQLAHDVDWCDPAMQGFGLCGGPGGTAGPCPKGGDAPQRTGKTKATSGIVTPSQIRRNERAAAEAKAGSSAKASGSKQHDAAADAHEKAAEMWEAIGTGRQSGPMSAKEEAAAEATKAASKATRDAMYDIEDDEVRNDTMAVDKTAGKAWRNALENFSPKAAAREHRKAAEQLRAAGKKLVGKSSSVARAAKAGRAMGNFPYS